MKLLLVCNCLYVRMHACMHACMHIDLKLLTKVVHAPGAGFFLAGKAGLVILHYLLQSCSASKNPLLQERNVQAS